MNTFNVQDSVINDYFSKLNEGDFKAVSNLFSVEGCLQPPFEKEICGRVAIAQYLKTEANDIKTFPQVCIVQPTSDESIQYQVTGYVKTRFFKVNVGWSIHINSAKEIVSVDIKLLAELQNLIVLKRT